MAKPFYSENMDAIPTASVTAPPVRPSKSIPIASESTGKSTTVMPNFANASGEELIAK